MKYTQTRSPAARALFIGLCLPLALWAEPKLELEMSTAAQITEQVDGVTTVSYTDQTEFRAGDKQLYSIRYLNSGDSPANGAALIGIIPPDTRFLEVLESTTLTQLQFSVDDAKTFHAAPVIITTQTADGHTIEKQISSDAYTHIRFILKTPVAPKESGTLRYLVEVR